MPLIVNLSTTHDYSIDETVAAFVKICNQHSKGCLRCTPGFFQNWANYAWVMAKYQANYASLIEPYKLGKISTEKFLDNLTKIFYFLGDMDKETRDTLLANAWNASIKLSEKTQERFAQLVEEAKNQPVYLISNTSELNANAILALLKEKNPSLKFNDAVDTRGLVSSAPVEVLPNIYLCLSYRYGAFKTDAVIEHLCKDRTSPITLVSQYPGDLKKGAQLGLDSVLQAEDFYNSMSNALMKKSQ
jgi:hypothetical protein